MKRHSGVSLTLLMLATLIGANRAAAESPPITTRINCGGGGYADAAGHPWLADAHFDSGNVQSTSSAITGTADPALYQSQRVGAVTYRIAIARGMVEVNLHFAELTALSAGSRVFDIYIDGTLVADDVDVYREAGGRFRALTRTVRALVNDDTMDLLFVAAVGAPMISAFAATPIPSLDSTPPTIDFGSVAVGATSANHQVRMVNIGSLTVHVTELHFVGAQAASFHAVDFCPVNMAPGAVSVANVAFSPLATGDCEASLVIELDNAQHYVPVFGMGVATAQAATKASADRALSPWTQALDIGCGWKWLPWFGYFRDDGSGWIFHEDHGWMYSSGTGTESIWLWNADADWMWTSATAYPYLYSVASGSWWWYQVGSTAPRWFYNFGTGRWIAL